MGSMINGLVVGALAAGYVSMQYGDGLDTAVSKIRGYLSPFISASVEETPIQPASPAEIPEAPGKSEDSEGTVAANSADVARSEQAAVPATPTLSQRWAAFVAGPPPVPEGVEFPWRPCFRRAAASYDLPESLLLAVASGESGFDAAARSPKDAVGLMQIRWPQTGRHLGIYREADLYDPCTNVDAGARYLSELMSRFNNDLHRTLAAYNYGPSRITGASMPEGARWYSQYIYQHLQQIVDAEHVPSSELLRGETGSPGGHLVLMRFSRPQRARDFVHFLQGQAPGLDVHQQSEVLGQQEVVLLYSDQPDRDRALALLAAAGLDSLVSAADRSHTL